MTFTDQLPATPTTAPPDVPLAVRAEAPSTLDLPPADLGLTWRPLGADDVPALAALVEAGELADDVPYRTTPGEVADTLDGDWKDLTTDSIAGFDEGGRMRAYALVEVKPGDQRTVRALLSGTVHPDWRGRGVGRAVLAWAQGRGRQMLAASGKELPARISATVDGHLEADRGLLEAAGFRPIRWYTLMRRDVRTPLPELSVADGVEIVPWTPELDEEVRVVNDEVFADHWGSEPSTPQTWAAERSHHVPEWSFVALDRTQPGSPVVGYLLSDRFPHHWDAAGYTAGHTDFLGVRRSLRGKGLATALLVHAMAAYRGSGMEYATLLVDTANPSGAHLMYAGLGYEVVHEEVLHSIAL